MFRLKIVLFVATCICVTEVYGSCNQYDIQYCMKPIYDLRHRLGISDELKYFPIYKLTAQTLDDYCVDGEKAGQCLNNLVGCVSVERNLFKGFLDSFDYLCKKTLNEYKTYQPCLAKSTVFPAVLKCDRDTSQHLKSRKTDVFHDANTQICSIIKDDYSCIRNAVQPECGTKAANWQVTYVNTVLTPILHQVGCNVKGKTALPPANKIPHPEAAADTDEHVSEQCDLYSEEECVKPITDFRHQLGISDEIKYFPIYWLNGEQLDQYCLYGEQAARCLKKLTGCTTLQRSLFQGLVDSFDFLCLKTLDEYKSHESCYAKSVVVDGLERCGKEMTAQLKVVDAKNQICRIAKNGYSCIRSEVEDECGKEAADWEVAYLKKILTPMLNEVGCHILPMWAIWVIGIGAGLLLLVVTTIVCVMLVARRKKGKLEANRANDFHNVLSGIPPTSENNVKVV